MKKIRKLKVLILIKQCRPVTKTMDATHCGWNNLIDKLQHRWTRWQNRTSMTSLQMTVFWDVVMRGMIDTDRRFRNAYCLHHQRLKKLSHYTSWRHGTRWGWVVSVTSQPCLSPWERNPGTQCTGGWVSPRAVLDKKATGKKSFRLCRGLNLDRPVLQAVARHYTDWATRLTSSEERFINYF
jgi:hypothetical protein